MATKISGTTTETRLSMVMQAQVIETQWEIIDDWATDEVLGIGSEDDEDEDEEEDEVGSDIEELDEDDLDEDDSDEDDSDAD